MDNQDWVLDEKRGKGWNSASEAVAWYQAELDRVEAERDEWKWMYEGLCK
jgi:hypothetical protein